MNHTHKPLGLLPAAGQERTYALIIAGVPLLLILLTAVLPQSASDGGGSASGAVSGNGGYSYQPTVPDPATPDTSTASIPASTTYGAESTGGTDATALSPSPADTQSPTGTDSATPGTDGAADPGATVQRYFDAINGHDFKTAWDLGGKNLDSSYASFVAGFAGTEQDTVSVASVQDTTVSVSLLAQQTDGTQKSYSGQYTVVDGVITHASVTPAD
ncbi:hypothetical protein BIV25_16130 [Streptomyces sp. MUSC 14]|uniref:hypothetical protein n=1 Tax=Streptomyces sp. MUSC 14 TaxID=1354889 RepID=UPI0008F5EEE4|nr:hypothetical protein [Streptomyces sp. MUSC 14]OIJ97294.1 hypothetical protein BIV25_16130 [Streptomyces sp. MUSC 14]